MKVETPAIKVFESGQQVRVEGYQALGVVTAGNKHSAANGFDTVFVAIGTREMMCATGDVEATGVLTKRGVARVGTAWISHWAPVGAKRVEVQGHSLEPREMKICGRDTLLFVPPFLAEGCATEDEVKDDMWALDK